MDGAISRSGRVAFVLFVCVLLVVSPVAGVATPPGGQAQQSLSATGVSAQTSSDGTSSSTAPICSEVAYEGDGTESTPYEITNVSQLQCIESQGLDAHYVLTADIDASVTSKWNNGNGFDPIGENDTYSFTGSLDGTNHSISNLTINRSSEETVGLFGAMGPGGGTVENLALSGVSVVGYGRVGAVAGDMWGGTTISEVSVSGSIFGDGSKIGGIAGRSYGVIERSYSTADVTGFSSVGGVAGETIEEITASYATGTITGSSSVGGIVGQNNFGTVSASYWDINETDQTTSAGGTGLTTMEMVGTDARENMDGFGFGTTWRATSSYPRFAWQTAPVNGTLSAANGASLSGGSIGIFTITDEDEIEGIDTDVGENGTFRIDGGFPDTTYMVAFGDDDAGTTSNGVPDLYAVDRVSPPADLGTVTIPEAHNVTVRVTDREGEPIQGADVALEHTNGDAVVKEGERNATNENGYLTIDGDNSLELVGNVTVGAEYRGVNNTTNVEALSNDREITVQLTRPDVTGNLSAANGASLKNDSIGLYRPTSDGTEVIDTTVNEDGNFTIRGASADRNYSLAFGDTNGTDSSNGVPDLYAIDIVSPPADVGEIDIPEAHNVSVRVVDQDGSPIESAGVAIEHTNGDAGIFEGGDDLTNETGYLSVDGSTSFEFVGNLTVGARYRGVVNATNVTVDEDKDITVELSGYEVNGTVTDANNDPVPNGSVTYDAFDEEREQFWQRTTTTEAGAYQTHLFPADYQIRFRQSEGDRYPLDGVPDIYTADSVFVDGPTQNDIALPEAHQLQIQVVSGTQPLADETVELTHLNESGGTGIEAETNSTGWVQLGGTSGVEVVGEAKDGSAALETVREHDPDVVTMDIEMPTMNGLEAVDAIMDDHPTPVLMLSAHAEENADVTFEALDRGAVDFVTKPGGEVTSSMPRVKKELVEKVESAARVDLSANARASIGDRRSGSAGTERTRTDPSETDRRATDRATGSTSDRGETTRDRRSGGGGAGASGTTAGSKASGSGTNARRTTQRPSTERSSTTVRSTPASSDSASAAATPESDSERTYPDVGTLVVGASTGGPNVVERVLTGLPRAANLRILVVQHMPEGFTSRFATRLDDRSAYSVREAESGERIDAGEARVAPGGTHLLATGDRSGRLKLELTDTEPIHGVRPAIDLTMASAVETVTGPLCGALLTGMGRDGVDGMERIDRGGGHTIAQDEATSAIFGMPRRAIETGCVDVVAPAEEIAENALRYFAEE